jgi:hypothetical protein
MEFRDVSEKPKIGSQDSLGSRALERRLQQAEDVQPSKFPYYDVELGGEARTSVVREGGLYNVAQAELFQNGTPIRLRHGGVQRGRWRGHPV